MKKYIYIVFAVAAISLFAGCKSQKAVVATFSDLNGEWSVVEMNGKKQETNQVLVFDVAQSRLSGNAGCNRLTGGIEYSDAQKHIIKFPHIATTRMACQNMEGEQELLRALDKVVRFAAEGNVKPVGEIALFSIDNSKLLVLQKK